MKMISEMLLKTIKHSKTGTCNASSEVECLKLRAGTRCAFVDDSRCLSLREAKKMKDIGKLQEPKCPTSKTHGSI